MALTYRTRRFFRRLWITLLSLALIAAVAWLIWVFWLDRFVVYSRDGAKFDFSHPGTSTNGELAVPPEEEHSITIVYNDNAASIDGVTELMQINGYYADAAALREDISTIRARIDSLPKGTAVMLDLKNINGYFL